VVKTIAKIKNSVNGDYIWRESVRAGEPDRLLNLPIHMSEYAPNTMTASQYVGILGDFSFYHIADSLEMEFQRLVELYAATGQIGFHAGLETDAMPVLEEAFIRVKLAAG
jgi:HK97 family phage major capsid protein